MRIKSTGEKADMVAVKLAETVLLPVVRGLIDVVMSSSLQVIAFCEPPAGRAEEAPTVAAQPGEQH